MTRHWTPLAGPAVLWIAHFVAVYGFASLACAARINWFAPQATIFWSVVGLTAAGLALAVTGFARHTRKLGKSDVSEQDAFLSRTSLLLYGLSAVGMLWVALPAVVLPGCV